SCARFTCLLAIRPTVEVRFCRSARIASLWLHKSSGAHTARWAAPARRSLSVDDMDHFPPLEKHWFGEALATRLAMLRSIWLMGNAPPREAHSLGNCQVACRQRANHVAAWVPKACA